ncbi:TRAP transporter fused permease subunit [Streptomyces sp. HNM0663]|uniref:TRAP transporter fused permease subunit n=1 Tax=Streptomyces chengmaiensis TaxID=3040919 RepID=A0ABT6HKV9_9ACTN|nr:TRAP transporter fused permease subunit [Streptomyces chengmaiensis]MDH2388966.1 TRAP transporter fused permease subunit [Streptomyces chengmaiensis]
MRQTTAPDTSDDAPPAEAADDRPLWHRLAAARWGQSRAATAVGYGVLAITLALGCFQIYTAVSLSLNSYLQRVLHLMFVLVLVFVTRPAGRGRWARRLPMAVVDALLVLAAVTVSLYPVLDYDGIVARTGIPSTADLAMGAVATLLLLEACRRTIGTFMAVLVTCFLVYAWIGPLLPGLLSHRGYTVQRIVSHNYLFQEGIYGLALGVAASFVFMFILFGAVLEKTGGGNFFINIAYVLTGKYRGGPAKGAVVASAFMGSVSGSAIANTVTTGAFTIPMMKKVGYRSHEAGGVEAAASTGGQLLPPIMGAGAFVMAELIGVPYIEIVKVAIIPALMYFAVIFLFVDILARRNGISGLPAENVPRLREVMAGGFHFLPPFVLLVTLLTLHVTPLLAGLYATAALAAAAMLRAGSRLTLKEAGEVFTLAARNTLSVSVATAAAGVVVGVVGLTGLGLKFSSMMLSWGGGYLLPTLLLIAAASLVLGMGLPVTAAYIVLIVLAGPALLDLGVPLIVAHMIVYWYSQDSNVTPPVALSGFAAAGIAGSSPMRTSVAAWKFSKGLYVIPLLMAYSPLLLNGPLTEVVLAVVTGLIGLLAFAVAIEGFWLRKTTPLERLAAVAATGLLLSPYLVADAIGAALALAVVAAQLRGPRPPASAAPTPEAASAV